MSDVVMVIEPGLTEALPIMGVAQAIVGLLLALVCVAVIDVLLKVLHAMAIKFSKTPDRNPSSTPITSFVGSASDNQRW